MRPLKRTSAQVPLSRLWQMAPLPADRGPPRPKPERRGEAGVSHTGRVRLRRVRGPESPRKHVRYDAPGRTDTRPRRHETPLGAGAQTHPRDSRVTLGLGREARGWGFRDTPTPGNPRAEGGELRVEKAHCRATVVGISQLRPMRREGGKDGGRRQEAPPTCPPSALRHQAGTGTLGRSRLEGLTAHIAVQATGPCTLLAGKWLSGGHLQGNGSREYLLSDFTWP